MTLKRFTFWREAASIIGLSLGFPAMAYYSTLDDGKILNRGEYRVTAGSQFVTSEDTGINLSGRFSHWWKEDLQVEGLAGFGQVDFQAGAFVKWVPIPDYENQPALGLKFGGLYGSIDGESEFSFRVHPIISKSFDSEFGEFTPYASLPLGMRFKDSKINLPTQITGGSFYRHKDLENVMFALELGFELNKAFNYITLGAVIEIDDEEGLVIK